MSAGMQLVIFFPALIVVGTALLLLRVVRRAGRNRPSSPPARPFRHWPWVVGVVVCALLYGQQLLGLIETPFGQAIWMIALWLSTPFLIALLIVLAYYRRAYLLATPAKN